MFEALTNAVSVYVCSLISKYSEYKGHFRRWHRSEHYKIKWSNLSIYWVLKKLIINMANLFPVMMEISYYPYVLKKLNIYDIPQNTFLLWCERI